MQEKHELKYCGRCFVQFTCKVGDVFTGQCSTVSLSKHHKNFLLETNHDFFCADCMKRVEKLIFKHPTTTGSIPQLFIEGLHFYKAVGYLVFTEPYHYLKRQFSGNKCRHCAYGNKKQNNGITRTN